jgi:hypothetical protein
MESSEEPPRLKTRGTNSSQSQEPRVFRPGEALALWAIALLASALVGTHGLAYWDAADYVRHAIDGTPSGLLLGRPLFLLISRTIVDLGVEPSLAEPVLRWFWAAISALAAPALASLALALGLARPAAMMAALCLALSPSFAHTSHHVLTDGPALAMSIAALAAAARDRSIVAGLLLAAAIATRETAVVHVAALVLLLGVRRGTVAVAIAAASLAGVIWIFPPQGVLGWFGTMAQSAGSRSIELQALAVAAIWVLAAGPAPVAIGIRALFDRVRDDRVRLVALPSLIATLALVFYPDGWFSPRYVLAAAPLAFFLPAARRLASRPAIAALLLIAPLAVMPWLARPSHDLARRGSSVIARVPALPERALVVPGHFCAHVLLAMTIHERRDLNVMCPGWDWPRDPKSVLDAAITEGRPVALDLDDAAWPASHEKPLFEQIRQWREARSRETVNGWEVVRR